ERPIQLIDDALEVLRLDCRIDDFHSQTALLSDRCQRKQREWGRGFDAAIRRKEQNDAIFHCGSFLLASGPPSGFNSVHRCATFSQPAGPPTLLASGPFSSRTNGNSAM